MRKCKCFMSIVLSTIYILGCAAFSQYGKLTKSAEENLKKYNYDMAFNQCLNALKINPEYVKAQVLMKDVYKAAFEYHNSEINKAKNSSSKFKFDSIVNEYKRLIEISEGIKSLPPLRNDKDNTVTEFKYKDYSKNLESAKQKAAESHYREGERLSSVSTLDSQKSAAKEFKKAQNYVVSYKNSEEMYERCRKAGMKRIAIIPFDNKSHKEQYGAIGELVSDRIISAIINDPSAMEFMEIISRDQLEQIVNEQKLGFTGIIDQSTAIEIGRVSGIHELITGKITQVSYTGPRKSEKKFAESARVSSGRKDSKGKTIWIDINAGFILYTKKAKATVNGSYNIIDIKTAKIKRSSSITGHYYFEENWADFVEGDERALSRETRRLCQKTEPFPPGESEMANMAASDLISKLAKMIISYAR